MLTPTVAMTSVKYTAAKLPGKFARLLIVLGFCALGNSASADTIFGLHGSVHLWLPELSGGIGQDTNAFDFTSSFSGEGDESVSLLAAVEHPIPLIPNIQLRTTPVTWSGFSDSASGTLGDFITIDSEVDAEFDLTLLDGTAYYEVLDNWVTLDLGVTIRRIDGTIEVVEQLTGTGGAASVDQVVPMGYVHARFDLPFSGLAVGARGNVLTFSGNTLSDVEAYVHLEFDLIPLLDVGIQGGFRRLGLDIEDIDDFESDAVLDGAYIAITGHF